MTDAIRAALAAGPTAGEWHDFQDEDNSWGVVGSDPGNTNIAQDTTEADAAYIAAANPTAILALLAELDGWKAKYTTLTNECDEELIQRDAATTELALLRAVRDAAVAYLDIPLNLTVTINPALPGATDALRAALDGDIASYPVCESAGMKAIANHAPEEPAEGEPAMAIEFPKVITHVSYPVELRITAQGDGSVIYSADAVLGEGESLVGLGATAEAALLSLAGIVDKHAEDLPDA